VLIVRVSFTSFPLPCCAAACALEAAAAAKLPTLCLFPCAVPSSSPESSVELRSELLSVLLPVPLPLLVDLWGPRFGLPTLASAEPSPTTPHGSPPGVVSGPRGRDAPVILLMSNRLSAASMTFTVAQAFG